MRGGTRRLLGWNDARGHGFRPVSPSRDPGIVLTLRFLQ